MNYFFGLLSLKFKSTLTIPKFQIIQRNFKLYPCEGFVDNNKWVFKKSEFTENKTFFLENNVISNDKIFFI